MKIIAIFKNTNKLWYYNVDPTQTTWKLKGNQIVQLEWFLKIAYNTYVINFIYSEGRQVNYILPL